MLMHRHEYFTEYIWWIYFVFSAGMDKSSKIDLYATKIFTRIARLSTVRILPCRTSQAKSLHLGVACAFQTLAERRKAPSDQRTAYGRQTCWSIPLNPSSSSGWSLDGRGQCRWSAEAAKCRGICKARRQCSTGQWQ